MPFTVLVVDDEPEIRRALAAAIGRAIPDLGVVEAGNGADGLALMRGMRVDVILSDYRMPGMDGVEFLRQAGLEQRGARRVMMTAYPDVSLAQRALNESHIDKFLTKPFRFREAVDVVRALLAEARDEGERARSLAAALAKRD